MTGYEFPSFTTGDDANWVNAELDLTATGGASSYSARQSVTLRTEELERFRDQLRALAGQLSGKAWYAHLEEELEIIVEVKRGKGTLSGFVQDHMGPELRFEGVEIDQTFVREVLGQFDSLVRAYPVRSKPFG